MVEKQSSIKPWFLDTVPLLVVILIAAHLLALFYWLKVKIFRRVVFVAGMGPIVFLFLEVLNYQCHEVLPNDWLPDITADEAEVLTTSHIALIMFSLGHSSVDWRTNGSIPGVCPPVGHGAMQTMLSFRN
ncbi:hypothetical protein LIER_01102 [Lithospermum erythrorhizon]|uniref:Uncharacterized protein n=1 Tax=Lithospermum erythrorhizon TaxID=34254 RepID=A0AAV3NL75_LITER